jgi:hypothetical protein
VIKKIDSFKLEKKMHVLINHDTMIRKGRWLKNKKEWGRA